ncbi:MAG: EthD family reductase [Hyphomicrobiaceae bacterium]|nr:EthD family reductase [Hyphomicrobiaceae bacterium]
MIAAISLMRRRPDITVEQFRKHWLHPHGTMTAELPGLRRYVQHHPIDGAGTNDMARELAIDGIPELWFDDVGARRLAYASPRMAECNVDSEHFVGAVTRLVTEPHVIKAALATDQSPRVMLLAVGAIDDGWSAVTEARIGALPGVTGYVRHKLLEQAPAPASKIPELKLAIAGIAEATFTSVSALLQATEALAADVSRPICLYRIEEHRLGACPSSRWIFRCESDSVQGYEQTLSPLEDRPDAAAACERRGLCA